MFFSNSTKTGTTRDTSIPNLAEKYKGPNVSQYGWTTYETQQVNQLIQYVEMAREFAERAEAASKYVESVSESLSQKIEIINTYFDEIEKYVVEIRDWYSKIKILHDNVVVKHEEVVARAKDAEDSATRSSASSAAAAASAVLAASLAKSAENFKNLAEASATHAQESETGSKNWYDKSYDLYLDLKKGQVYRGLWDPQTQKYPDNGGTNSVWDVVVRDLNPPIYDWDGKSWQTGQRLLYTLTDNVYSQVDVVLGVASVNGKTGAVRLDHTDVGLISLSEMDKRYVNSKMVVDKTTPNALSVIHLMPIPSSSDKYPRSFITGTVEVHRTDLSGEVPVFDRLEIAASSLGIGFTGSILSDSSNYRLVTYTYKNQRWLGLANNTEYPSCAIYFRGESHKNPDFAHIQFTISDYIVKSGTGDAPVYPNPDIQQSITGYTSSKGFYADGGKIYTDVDKPSANDLNALDKTLGGVVTGETFFTNKTAFGSDLTDLLKPYVTISSTDKICAIQAGNNTSGKLVVSKHEGDPLDLVNIVVKTDDDFKVNNKSIREFIPVVDKTTLGLDQVNNWPATNAINDPSDKKYATAKAVNDVNTKVEDLKTLAFVYSLIM